MYERISNGEIVFFYLPELVETETQFIITGPAVYDTFGADRMNNYFAFIDKETGVVSRPGPDGIMGSLLNESERHEIFSYFDNIGQPQ